MHRISKIHCLNVEVQTLAYIILGEAIETCKKLKIVMDMLDRLYSAFDELTARYDLFKVETIGDAVSIVDSALTLTLCTLHSF
eukprot:scaffold129346_cov41-Prasinocladus_malaysianus.AAC.1